MGKLTYNIIVRNDDHNSHGYWKTIRELAMTHGIQGPLIVCNTRRVTIAHFNDGSLETKVFDGEPYGKIPVAVRDYEARIGETKSLRWVIVPPSLVHDVKRSLGKVGLLKGNEYFCVEVEVIQYTDKTSRQDQATAKVPIIHNEAKVVTHDILAQLIIASAAKESEAELRRRKAARSLGF